MARGAAKARTCALSSALQVSDACRVAELLERAQDRADRLPTVWRAHAPLHASDAWRSDRSSRLVDSAASSPAAARAASADQSRRSRARRCRDRNSVLMPGWKRSAIARADRQQSQRALGAERRERHRADLRRNPCRTENRAARRGPVRSAACRDCSSDSKRLDLGIRGIRRRAGSGRARRQRRASSMNSTSTECMASKSSRRLVSIALDGARAACGRGSAAGVKAMDAVRRAASLARATSTSSFSLRSSDWLRSRSTSTWRSTRLTVAPRIAQVRQPQLARAAASLRSKKSG